ncbi:nuclear transport factor 2 family protein [Leucobacter sp. wl10]|uniref:nuclear transport factor 2 family protein n=1 Tax=Leucobacter sp. wl10 TaxID=2304677 RepID=UPI000E5B0811|nr:nuclear transport factor 2 family protein [Leucobacter sp. wl10]RGE21037.1 nuclear transport factor 2 family protein [Leucobacter sp. wl10]
MTDRPREQGGASGTDAGGRLDELTEIERSLWSNDAAIYATTFLPEAVLVFENVGRIGRDDAVAAIHGEVAAGRHWTQVDSADVTLIRPDEGVAVLSYRARARWNNEPAPSEYICTTVYAHRDARWRVVAHQQTSAPARRGHERP